MTRLEYEARQAWIDRALTENAILAPPSSQAWQFTKFVAAFIVACMLSGALIAGAAILLTKIYLV